MKKELYQPLSANVVPKFGGQTTFMRLPQFDNARELDACIYGLPLDWGTSARPGTRFGPRQIRAESTQIRPYNMGMFNDNYNSRPATTIIPVLSLRYYIIYFFFTVVFFLHLLVVSR